MARAWDKNRVAEREGTPHDSQLDTFLYCARAVLAEFRRFAIPWVGVLLGSMSTRQIRGGKERGRSAKAGRAVCAHGVPWIRYSTRVRGSGSVNQILSCPTHGILPCAQLVAGWAPLADRTLSSPPPSEKLSAVYGQKDCQLGCCYSVPSALQQQGKRR